MREVSTVGEGGAPSHRRSGEAVGRGPLSRTPEAEEELPGDLARKQGSSESSGAGGGRARGSLRQAGGVGEGARVSAEGRQGETAHSKQALDRGCRVSE